MLSMYEDEVDAEDAKLGGLIPANFDYQHLSCWRKFQI
jgi:hypothetical protein